MQLTQQQTHYLAFYLSLTCLLLGFSFSSAAKVSTPSSQQIVATWDTQQALKNSRASLDSVAWHIKQAQFPGVSNVHLRQASQMLKQLAKTEQSVAEYWYYQARVLEHQHQFEAALGALKTALQLEPNYVSAILMQANVLLLMGEPQQAKDSCKNLLAVTNVDIVLACTLQAAQGKAQIQAAFNQLVAIIERFDFSQKQQDASQIWLVQLAADFASQLNNFNAAEQLLQNYALSQASISFVSQWADVQLALNQPEAVLKQLSAIVEQAQFQDDALIMRLAMAEVQMAAQHKSISAPKTTWQQAATDRAALRLLRDDRFHAADLARYFLYVQPNRQKALYWAEQNLQQSRQHDDLKLLENAQNMAKMDKES